MTVSEAIACVLKHHGCGHPVMKAAGVLRLEVEFLQEYNSSLLAEVQALSWSEAKLLEVNGCANERQGSCRGYKAAKVAEGNE